MKRKILLRFLLIIVLSVIIILNISMFVQYKFLVESQNGDEKWSYVKNFSLNFQQYIVQKDGKPIVTEAGIRELHIRSAWIQILDEEGYEVYNLRKPKEALSHYAPSQMVYYNIYSGAIKDYTIYSGTAKINNYRWSYIIGFPMNKVAKYIFEFSPEKIKTNIFKALICLLIVPIMVFIVTGYIFGRNIANPIIHIIKGIGQLSKGEYDKKYAEKGLYKEVYSSFNNLSSILKTNEVERGNIEKMREEWIQNLSHDLKTPLASIKGYGELIADEEYALTAGEIKKYSHIIQEKAQYMEKLLEDLKLTQVLKRGLIPINSKDKDLVELLRDITIDVLNNPQYQKREIQFNSNKEQIIFSFDKSLLQRAFTNLIYNAIVHNDENARIIINIDKRDKIYVEIEDNGRGISKEDLDNLFERYYRGTSTGESHKGSGLGMNIAKQIIEVHGGTINVESTLAVGTKITVVLS
ncbi:signal transduction histidine kinase [Clostridium pascui]|uniref:HAMP domain-containing sensor histidine kinase n=1 Tax=Clostridium pascui TaxID=46609 RepID=UPI0019586608|nr:HAMP domain-containing sensor histidine kinase [Clostridium pascui]MBM7869761.1 signal transduction histidine kinase [Clostridium pascui]